MISSKTQMRIEQRDIEWVLRRYMFAQLFANEGVVPPKIELEIPEHILYTGIDQRIPVEVIIVKPQGPEPDEVMLSEEKEEQPSGGAEPPTEEEPVDDSSGRQRTEGDSGTAKSKRARISAQLEQDTQE